MHRGLLAIHAAQRFEKSHHTELRAILKAEFGECWYSDLPTGALLGIINLIECIPTNGLVLNDFDADDIACGNWTHGRFIWRRGPHVTKFRVSIPYRGRQGLFNVPDTALAEGGTKT